jgi:hypothetical protein
LYVNGERNRILFEGEENFLEDDTFETIDLESTLESGSIVTQKAEKKKSLLRKKNRLKIFRLQKKMKNSFLKLQLKKKT